MSTRTSLPRIMGVFLSLILATALAACGGSTTAATQPASFSQSQQALYEGDTTCFNEMTPQQRDQLISYTNDTGGSVTDVSNNTDGTEDVCVLKPDGQGGYVEQHYNKNDHFGDFWMYTAMLTRSRSVATAGLISGNLDAGDYLMLSLLNGFDDNDRPFHPYDNDGQGHWKRNTAKRSYVDRSVTNVYYGDPSHGGLKESRTLARKSGPPRGYVKLGLPRVATPQAVSTINADGRSAVTTSGMPVKVAKKTVVKSPNVGNPSKNTGPGRQTKKNGPK